ncbi:hypothetical protein F25303_5692 [Fusarium sp. NRRL 25303]|nr:hypothetical protein F25303_5692 [Fusarium sp. NRRL 25303]
MLFALTFTLVAAATAASAPPHKPHAKTATLPLKHVFQVTSIKSMIQQGQNRLRHVNNPAISRTSLQAGSITNQVVTYVAPVIIGGRTWDLIVDTGSSNTWCGAQESCEPSSTGKSTGGFVYVPYGSGWFYGYEFLDHVAFGSLKVASQSVGAATWSDGFYGVDGIIGFGPSGLTRGTVSNADKVLTFMDNLHKQGSIPSEVLAVSFRPLVGADNNDANGELTLGGVDSTKFTGALKYFPILTSGAAAAYWGISIASFTYGSTILALSGKGIVDTGTTLIYIPTAAYNNFLSAARGNTDGPSGLAIFTKKPTSNFGIKFGSTTYTLTPRQYLIPIAQYSFFGLKPDKYYSWIADGGSSSVNTIIGQKFLENYYSVFDTTKSRIGFARAI